MISIIAMKISFLLYLFVCLLFVDYCFSLLGNLSYAGADPGIFERWGGGGSTIKNLWLIYTRTKAMHYNDIGLDTKQIHF